MSATTAPFTAQPRVRSLGPKRLPARRPAQSRAFQVSEDPHLGLGATRHLIAGALAFALIAAGAVGWTVSDRPQPEPVTILG